MRTAAPPIGGANILLLAGVAALGSMAIHMLVPALPLIAADFRIDAARTQQIVGVYLFALGAGQLVAGQFIDRLGRRPVLLAGLGAYCMGTLAAYCAPGIGPLLAARAWQAFGGAAGVVSARVIVGDGASADDGAARQATLMTVVLVSPALSPAVGGALASAAGWRTILLLLAVASAAAWIAAWFTIAESMPAWARSEAGTAHPEPVLRSYARLLSDGDFLGAAGALAMTSSALYLFLANAPFLLIRHYGLSPRTAGFAFLFVAASSIAGTRLVRPIGRRTDPLTVGVALGLAGTLAALALSLAGMRNPASLIGPLMLLGAGAGVAGPAGIGRAIAIHPPLAGTAASLAGAGQMLISACVMELFGHFARLTHTSLCIALAFAAALACLCARQANHRAAQRGSD